MEKSWTLRAVDRSDARCIAWHRYYRSESSDDVEAYVAWVASRIESGVYVGTLAELNGNVIAGAGATVMDWGPTRGDPCQFRARVVNVNVYTMPAWRHQGIASALVREVVEACQALGIRTLTLAASAEGAPLYRSLGFAPYPEEMIKRPR